MKIKRFFILLTAIVCCAAMLIGLCSCKDSKKENDETQSAGSMFGITYNGVSIELNKSATDVLQKLGTPKRTDNLGDCGGIGVQTKYTYDNITVNTLKEEKGEVIHKIGFTSDLVSTSKGISVGANETDVTAKYGQPASSENGRYVYESGNLNLQFTIKDGKVSAIEYFREV